MDERRTLTSESLGQAERSRDSNRPQFEFITVSGTNIRGDTETRRRVRSRAQADYRRRNPPPPRNALTVDLDVGSWLQALSRDATLRPQHGEPVPLDLQSASSQANEVMRLNPAGQDLIGGREGAGIFLLVPSDQRPRARELWNHLYGGGCVIFKSMIEIGFLDILQGSASLTQMLSSSAWHRKQVGTGDHESSIDYARYSLMATRALRRRLDDPTQRANLETIIAILTFAAFANLTSNPHLINVHLDGLSHAISGVGGLTALQQLPIIWMMMYWIDIRGSYLQDIKPRYPQPYGILSNESKLRIAVMPAAKPSDSNSTLSQDPAVVHIFDAIQQVNSILTSEANTRGDAFWRTVLFPGFHFAPILYDLLSLPREADSVATQFSKRRECFRLAGILYISEVRAKFGMDNTGATSYAYKLLLALKSRDVLVSWGSDNHFLLWSLVIGSVSLCVPETLRLEFMDLLSEYPSITGIASLRDAIPPESRMFL
ncbi:transcriptional regulator family: Fungal Specific TF [Trichoderma aggressivum f. europaeum]|uniref:Transcriptional regulator family: Fungal Specific TF n=1 Tax=Trichoderma aggressivum f. europaeum TaxID=173218 RepID=A0AAE1IGI4_9HYPO|nr:transcriptional regulator family: Fungal Specific TF [Trichoderma aggressivum f. europaeum]